MANAELLDKTPDELQERLLATTDQEEIDDIVQIFNLGIQKRNLIRANSLSELQDMVVAQMGQRIGKRAGEFSNKELLEYLVSIQNIISKNSTEVSELPKISIQQNNTINVNGGMDRESKDRVRDVLKQILAGATKKASMQEDIVDVEPTIISEEIKDTEDGESK